MKKQSECNKSKEVKETNYSQSFALACERKRSWSGEKQQTCQTKPLTPTHKMIHYLLLDVLRTILPYKGVDKMKYKFNATFNIEGKKIEHKMEYDSVDIVKTLERRLKTAFPNATGIEIVLAEAAAMQVDPKVPAEPKGVK